MSHSLNSLRGTYRDPITGRIKEDIINELRL